MKVKCIKSVFMRCGGKKEFTEGMIYGLIKKCGDLAAINDSGKFHFIRRGDTAIQGWFDAHFEILEESKKPETLETITGTVTDDGLEIEVDDVENERQIVAMDDNTGESEGDRKYREKQEALRSEEAKNELERLRRNEKAARVFVTDYTDGNHRHKFGMFGG